MDLSLLETIEEVRDRLQPSDEGSLWLLFFAEPLPEPLVAAAFEGALTEVDGPLVENVATIIDGTPADAVLVVVPRRDGDPRPVDLLLWRELRVLRDGLRPRLLDLVVVGDSRHWSAEHQGNLGTAA